MTTEATIICFYKENCLDYPYKCSTCIHNRGKKHYFKSIFGDEK
jgi:hypothetical protein